MEQGQASRQLPRYKSHKTVWALKIKAISFDHDEARKQNRETDGSATITPVEEGYAPFKVDATYVRKHFQGAQELGGSAFAIVGGYYVVYSDGYKSWSPAGAFEEGYTRDSD